MAKRLPKEILDALSQLEPRMAQAIIEAFQNMTDAVALQRAEAAILAGDMEAAIEALRISPEWFTRSNEALRQAFLEGGAIAVAAMRVRDPYDGTRFVLGFDGRHIRAEEWISTRSSRLIADIVEDQRQMAREVIRAGVEAGRSPRQVALDLVGRVNRATGKREGGFIGLTAQQARWVRNAEAQIRSMDAGYLDRARRDKRYDAMVRKAIKDGKQLSEADLRRVVSRYKDRLLKMRADAIARTETLNALRAGRHEGFKQLIDSGKVRADQVVVTWSATMDGRTRDTHRSMNGQKIRMGQLFTSPSGAMFEYPGDVTHGAPPEEIIQCRCIAEYRIRSDLMRYED
ncbi:phage minor head protein [Paracoccus kondratievae]|uniref:Phage head morphogenesis domain-containing protein n=1 Tax=Paracoccus kondratievae TaxID=135740 RepID=A0AAD3NWZ7_9RHOB|nr:phage minor head protein [Paracoccus kondratievae]AZV00271.1 head morphogenesis protein [Paracoccus phage vB_PkoS_Pkon1]GLK63477.1 hypothetical protein GCM10017635_09470 [Paracoccus kondratievae]